MQCSSMHKYLREKKKINLRVSAIQYQLSGSNAMYSKWQICTERFHLFIYDKCTNINEKVGICEWTTSILVANINEKDEICEWAV